MQHYMEDVALHQDQFPRGYLDMLRKVDADMKLAALNAQNGEGKNDGNDR